MNARYGWISRVSGSRTGGSKPAARPPAHGSRVRSDPQQQREVGRECDVAETVQERRQRGRQQRGCDGRDEPALAQAAQREHRRDRLQQAVQRQPQIQCRKGGRDPRRERFQRQAEQRNAVGHRDAEAVRPVQQRRPQQRPVPGIAQERPLAHDVNHDVVGVAVIRQRRPAQDVAREHRRHEQDPDQQARQVSGPSRNAPGPGGLSDVRPPQGRCRRRPIVHAGANSSPVAVLTTGQGQPATGARVDPTQSSRCRHAPDHAEIARATNVSC